MGVCLQQTELVHIDGGLGQGQGQGRAGRAGAHRTGWRLACTAAPPSTSDLENPTVEINLLDC